MWLEKRIEDCADLDERVGLKSLLDIIKQVSCTRTIDSDDASYAIFVERSQKTTSPSPHENKKFLAQLVFSNALRRIWG